MNEALNGLKSRSALYKAAIRMDSTMLTTNGFIIIFPADCPEHRRMGTIGLIDDH